MKNTVAYVAAALILLLLVIVPVATGGINYPIPVESGADPFNARTLRTKVNAAFREMSSYGVQRPHFNGYSGREAARNATKANVGAKAAFTNLTATGRAVLKNSTTIIRSGGGLDVGFTAISSSSGWLLKGKRR